MRKERSAGNLTIKLRGPASGDLIRATRASALACQAVVLDEVAVAANQSFSAMRTVSVFATFDHPWKVSGIDVTEPSIAADFCGSLEISRSRVPSLAHLVVGVEGRYVPGDVR